MIKRTKDQHAKLLELWRAQIRLMHAYTEAVAVFNVEIARVCGELCVPTGYAIDVLGDGEVKPQGDCAKVPS